MMREKLSVVTVGFDERWQQKKLDAAFANSEIFELLAHLNTRKKAIEMCKSKTPDVVLVWIEIQGTHSKDFVKVARDILPNTCICIFSIAESMELFIPYINAGADDFLNFGFDASIYAKPLFDCYQRKSKRLK